MYIETLKISNFRAFDNAEMTLNHPGRENALRLPNVNLFIGGNGAGKSSVFQAVALTVLAPIIFSSGFRAEFLVRRTLKQGVNALSFQNSATVRSTLFIEESELVASPIVNPVEAEIGVQRNDDFEFISYCQFVEGFVSMKPGDAIYRDQSAAFFLVGYGASRRTERPEGYSEASRSPRYQRVAGLFEEHVGLVPFTFGHLQLNELKYLDEARTLLNSLLPPEVQLSNEIDSQRRPLFNSFGTLLPFNALSDGFRGFIGWVWDLLLQLARSQSAPDVPSSSGGETVAVLENQEAKTLTNLSGVVIVDEIDLFLHPEWQRLVIEQVATTFPKLQFLFSSHSPLVAGTLEPKNIFVLETDDDGAAVVKQYEENIHGLTANQVLTSSYFGLASTRAPGSGTLSDTAARQLGYPDFASAIASPVNGIAVTTAETESDTTEPNAPIAEEVGG